MRTFMVDGTLLTAQRYGEFMLDKQYRESSGATQNPKQLTNQQIEEFGLDTLQERMMEDETVYEVDEYGNKLVEDEERKRLIEEDSQFISFPPPDYTKMTNEQIKLRTNILKLSFKGLFRTG